MNDLLLVLFIWRLYSMYNSNFKADIKNIFTDTFLLLLITVRIYMSILLLLSFYSRKHPGMVFWFFIQGVFFIINYFRIIELYRTRNMKTISLSNIVVLSHFELNELLRYLSHHINNIIWFLSHIFYWGRHWNIVTREKNF